MSERQKTKVAAKDENVNVLRQKRDYARRTSPQTELNTSTLFLVSYP